MRRWEGNETAPWREQRKGRTHPVTNGLVFISMEFLLAVVCALNVDSVIIEGLSNEDESDARHHKKF